jgi:hypothetical protein
MLTRSAGAASELTRESGYLKCFVQTVLPHCDLCFYKVGLDLDERTSVSFVYCRQPAGSTADGPSCDLKHQHVTTRRV